MEYITLNNGVKMPIIGFGTYKITDPEDAERCVLAALKAGYRMIDTAQIYGNEEAVGNAIKKSGIKREEIFLVTKISIPNSDGDLPTKTFEESLRKLQTDYVDMLMVHWPYNNYYNCYRQIEELYKKKKTRAIGISNFDIARTIDLVHFNEFIPQVNQIETHLFCQRVEEREWFKKYNIAVEGYGTLGQGKRDDMYSNPIVQSLAKKYNKTEHQIVLRYFTQLGIPVIPKSTHEERIIENISIFDFSFTNDELTKLSTINENRPNGGMAENPERCVYIIGDKR